MRPKHIPTNEGSAARVVAAFALAFAFLVLVAFFTGCSPRSMASLNKQAPLPPYAGQYHGGMDRAQYLRDMEPLDAN